MGVQITLHATGLGIKVYDYIGLVVVAYEESISTVSYQGCINGRRKVAQAGTGDRIHILFALLVLNYV